MILKKPFFLFLFIFIFVVAVLQTIAMQLDLYWIFGWFDIMMHFLGGFWFGFVAVWFFFFSDYVKVPNNSKFSSVLFIALLSALGIGVAWEIFEYFTGITFTVNNYVADTILDIIMDGVGGFVSALFLHKYILVLGKKDILSPKDLDADDKFYKTQI